MEFVATPSVAPPPRGMTAIGVFLLFGAVMAFIAGTSLLRRGTALDRMWALNPRAYDELAIGQDRGSLVSVACSGAHTRCHSLAQATAVGMAVGCGHYRNSGSGGFR